MKKRNVFILLLVLAMTFSFFACNKDSGTVDISGEGSLSTSSPTQEETAAFKFNTTDIYAETVSSDMFKNSKITLVNVWGTFCGPCINEMPFLGELAKEYEKSDVQFLGVVTDAVDYYGNEDPDAVVLAQEITKEAKADYTHIIPSSQVLSFLSDVTAVPTTFFVDSEGKVIGEFIVGSKEKEAWKNIIDSMLQEVEN